MHHISNEKIKTTEKTKKITEKNKFLKLVWGPLDEKLRRNRISQHLIDPGSIELGGGVGM